MSLNQNLNKYPLETREEPTKTKCDKLRGMGTSRLYFLFLSVLLLAHTYFGDFSFFFACREFIPCPCFLASIPTKIFV